MSKEQLGMVVWHYEPMTGTARAVLSQEGIDRLSIKRHKEMLYRAKGFEIDYDEDGYPCGWSKYVSPCKTKFPRVEKFYECEKYQAEFERLQEQVRKEKESIETLCDTDNPEDIMFDMDWGYDLRDNVMHEVILESTWLEQGPFIVCGWNHTQRYGGPEEGGWYYTDRVLEKWCALPTYEMACWLSKQLNEQNKKWRDKANWRVLGGDDTVTSNYPEGYIPTGWASRSKMSFEVSNHAVGEPPKPRPHYC